MVCLTRVIIPTGSNKGKATGTGSRTRKGKTKTIASELEWVRANPRARQAKNKGRLARFDELVQREEEQRQETTELFIPTGERLGDKVIEINAITKSFDDKCLIENFSALIPRGAIVGIIGGNGAGKSTLFKMITGSEEFQTKVYRIRAYSNNCLHGSKQSLSRWQKNRLGRDLRQSRHH